VTAPDVLLDLKERLAVAEPRCAALGEWGPENTGDLLGEAEVRGAGDEAEISIDHEAYLLDVPL
jgi:hypothetical protein